MLEQLKGELSKFVPDAVKELLERDPSATQLEKRQEEVSVLFLDIAGYTRLSEQVEAKRLNQLVQTYFSAFLEIIRKHQGDVNETAGDGLMVIFQSKSREPGRGPVDHALNAARAALAIRQRTVELNEEHAGVFPSVALHMGINSGEAWVGATKIGGAGSQRWTFTATGTHDQPGRALRRLGPGRRDRRRPRDRRARPGRLRAGEPGREELQERVAAAARLPHHPARGLRQDRLTGYWPLPAGSQLMTLTR